MPLTTDAELSLDRIGAISPAPQILGDGSEPCCALGATDGPDMWEEGIGLSDLILHDAGRFLGLHHPLASFDICGADHYNGYYWYASPMAYSPPLPSTACGFLYGMVYDRPCGNPSASCAVFERGRLADARLASLHKGVNEGMSWLGGGQAGSARMLAGEPIERFGRGDILPARGALPKIAEARAAVLGTGGPSAGLAPEAPPRPAAPPAIRPRPFRAG